MGDTSKICSWKESCDNVNGICCASARCINRDPDDQMQPCVSFPPQALQVPLPPPPPPQPRLLLVPVTGYIPGLDADEMMRVLDAIRSVRQ